MITPVYFWGIECRMVKQQVYSLIDSSLESMLKDIAQIINVPAVNIAFDGGVTEEARCDVIEALFNSSGVFDSVQRYNAVQQADGKGHTRPNLVAIVKGEDSKLPTTWIVSHMDEVPVGNREEWYFDPRTLTIALEQEGSPTQISLDEIRDYAGTDDFQRLVAFGRSVDDDIRPGIHALYALKAMKKAGITPKGNIGVVYVADEETGRSEFGIRHLAESVQLFKPEDLIIVPDFGVEAGDEIYVAEKSRLVLKITTSGRQGHAAHGYGESVNANEVSSRYQMEFVDWFREQYSEKDSLFFPPENTIQMTQREVISGSANVVPGKDESYIDMRLHPKYQLGEVVTKARELADECQSRYGVQIQIDNSTYRQAPPGTSPESAVVQKLRAAIKDVRGVDAKVLGIGGGTCASHLRRVQIDGGHLQAAVHLSYTNTLHKVNERARLSHMLTDSKVLAHVFMN